MEEEVLELDLVVPWEAFLLLLPLLLLLDFLLPDRGGNESSLVDFLADDVTSSPYLAWSDDFLDGLRMYRRGSR